MQNRVTLLPSVVTRHACNKADCEPALHQPAPGTASAHLKNLLIARMLISHSELSEILDAPNRISMNSAMIRLPRRRAYVDVNFLVAAEEPATKDK